MMAQTVEQFSNMSLSDTFVQARFCAGLADLTLKYWRTVFFYFHLFFFSLTQLYPLLELECFVKYKEH